jgi:SAM-dependent methyltransferase
MEQQLKAGSHRATNEVVFNLIAAHLSPDARVLDFGAGVGHMSQRVGQHFEALGRDPQEHLIACEVVPEIFKYQKVRCQRIGTDSIIPFEDESFDLIYAIEVIEHTSRPYDFLFQAFAKLRPGGVLVLSTPNSLHVQSRLSFLLTGFAAMFGPPSIEEANAGRICGHIMPLNYAYFAYGLRKAGFGWFGFHKDRTKRSAHVLALLLYPFLKIGQWTYNRKLKRYDSKVWKENRAIVRTINSLAVLTSRSCVVVAGKAPAKRSGLSDAGENRVPQGVELSIEH